MTRIVSATTSGYGSRHDPTRDTGERLVREQPFNRSNDLAQPFGSERRSSKDNGTSSYYSNHVHAAQCVRFDMWANAPNTPDQIEDAFHVYTSLDGDQYSPPMPLKNIMFWRTYFPHLAVVLSDVKDRLDCELILLEANLELVDDFPPAGSRLGVSLELDITELPYAGASASHQMKDWVCRNYIYEDGQMTMQAEHDIPQPHTTRIKPPFEASWWAKIFTQLTHQTKETGKKGQYIISDDPIRQYFRSLSAVQEIRAWEPFGQESKRMAILLWKFRQTRPGETGITTWRRMTTSPDAIDLPPLYLGSPLKIPPHSPVYPYEVPQAHNPLQYPSTAQDDQVRIDGGLPAYGGINKARLEAPTNEFEMEVYNPNVYFREKSSDESMDLSMENSGAADVVQPLGLTQIGAITDSGYASTNLDKHKYVQSTWDAGVELPIFPEEDPTEHLETSHTQDHLEMAAARTIYSDTSSIASLRKESYIGLFGEDLFTKIVSWQPDAQATERISEVLPELLRAFALKIGHNAPSQIHRDVMVFIHKNRE